MYIHELADWPAFTWDSAVLVSRLGGARQKQGQLHGRMEAHGFQIKDEAVLETLTADVVESSAIEGEMLPAPRVRSSIARRMGLDTGGLQPADRHIEGVVEMMLDATRHFDRPLTDERLLGWHSALFSTGRSGMPRITVGTWRDDATSPMQVVSGPIGRERVHFEAPPAARLPVEVRRFLDWFDRDIAIEPVLKAALAHLWFVTIHPFDDGNGRIARAIADMALARSQGSARRFYSMSAQIHTERADYYATLERTQRGGLDVTPWMAWFLGCLSRAIDAAGGTLAGATAKARFWEGVRDLAFNERQRLVIGRLLDGFEGKLTTSKWAALAKCSQDTALRDIQELVDRGVLLKNPGGGRSTSYALAAKGRSGSGKS